MTRRTQYLSHINRAYREHFENLDQYKHEDAFKRCLSQLTLDDVRTAITRAKQIMEKNAQEEKTLKQYKGFSYYTGNPALTIWESIERILKECGLLNT